MSFGHGSLFYRSRWSVLVVDTLGTLFIIRSVRKRLSGSTRRLSYVRLPSQCIGLLVYSNVVMYPYAGVRTAAAPPTLSGLLHREMRCCPLLGISRPLLSHCRPLGSGGEGSITGDAVASTLPCSDGSQKA